MNEVLSLLITAGLASLITVLGSIIKDKLEFNRSRKAKKEDKDEAKFTQEHKDLIQSVNDLKVAMKFLLLEKIRERAELYIAQEEITFNDRKLIHLMHNIYHTLGGNGDLDLLMADIDALPLKVIKDDATE